MNVADKPKGSKVAHLDWKTTLIMIDVLAHKIKESKEKFDYIYGIPRGGLIPAVILSHRLKIPLTTSLYKVFNNGEFGNIIMIDDISDTGKILLRESNTWNKTATLHIRHDTKFKPDFFVKEIKDNTWIQYPWEED